MANNSMFGWDLLYKVIEPQIRNHHDVLICLTHLALIHRGFRCVGVGEDTSHPDPTEQSELLPEGWNAANKISLRYLHEGKLYLLSAIFSDGSMLINMNRVVDHHATGTCISVMEVKEVHGSLSRLIPNHEAIVLKIRNELIDPMFQCVPSREVHTQTPQEVLLPQRLEPRNSDNFFTPPQRDIPQPPRPYFSDPLREVGRSDLDPFTPGGGMLFQPPGFGPRVPAPGFGTGLPRGAIPPGARFDPFRPPGSGGPRQPPAMNPDHDHLPPPGYDDMFM